jgi:hypothetical protein
LDRLRITNPQAPLGVCPFAGAAAQEGPDGSEHMPSELVHQERAHTIATYSSAAHVVAQANCRLED